MEEEFTQLHKQEISNKFTSVSEFTIDALSELVSDAEKEDKNGKSPKENDFYKEERNENKAEVKDEFNAVKSDCVETNSAGTLQFQSETSQNVYTDEAQETKQDKTDGTKKVLEAEDGKKTECSDEARYSSSEISNNFTDVSHDSCVIHNIVSNPTKPVHSRTRELKPKKHTASKKKSLDIPPITNAVIHIEKCLREWFTIESMCFLFGEEKVKEMVEQKGERIKEYYKAIPKASWDPQIEQQYLAICRRLNIMEIEDNDCDYQQVTKPLPDYATLREEVRKTDLKVTAYYQGNTAYEDAGSINISETDKNFTPVLPLVDIHAQNALRRRIVLDCLNRV
jgi:Fe-S cluster biosynthesis and repair protein YggX